ncbi:unnamed protein product [Albugo candida]|nr:unnamed protein product [Albugo candida]|eukprot:CCI42562.1 unnamed protein product [Albugo candida]
MEIWMEKNIQEDAGDVSSSEDRVNPDGDVEFTDYKHFHYPSCPQCGNIMKPHVIFFGENMTKHVRQRSAEIVDDAQALLVIGSSLQVYSALRLVNQAHLKKIHIGIINFGPTRADLLCQERFQNGCTELLDGVQLELVQANSLVVTEL